MDISPTCTIYFLGFVSHQEASCFSKRRTRAPCQACSSSLPGRAVRAAQCTLLRFTHSGTPETAFHTGKGGKVRNAFHLKISAGQSLISSKLASLNIISWFKIVTSWRWSWTITTLLYLVSSSYEPVSAGNPPLPPQELGAGGAGWKHGRKEGKYSWLVMKPETPRSASTRGLFRGSHPRLAHQLTPWRPPGRHCAFKGEAPPLPALQAPAPSAPPTMTSSLPSHWLRAPSVKRRTPLAPVRFPRCSRSIGRFSCRSPAPLRSDWRVWRGAGASAVARRRPAVARPGCGSGGGAFSGGDGHGRVRARWSRDQVSAELRLGREPRGGLGERQRQTEGGWARARPEGPPALGHGRSSRSPALCPRCPAALWAPPALRPGKGPGRSAGRWGWFWGSSRPSRPGSADRGSQGFGRQPPLGPASPTRLPWAGRFSPLGRCLSMLWLRAYLLIYPRVPAICLPPCDCKILHRRGL